MSNLIEMLDLRSNLEKWGQITIKNWKEVIAAKKIGKNRDLDKSFESKVQGEQAAVLGLSLKFLMYGRYRDMNVHKGIKAYERNQNNANRIGATRYEANVGYVKGPAGRWYNKPKMAQIHRMREILGIDLGNAVSEEMVQMSDEIKNHKVIY